MQLKNFVRKHLSFAKNVYKAYLKPLRLENKKIDVEIKKSIKGIYLIATKRGLFLLNNNNLYKLLSGEFYGITRYNRNIYVYQNLKFFGRILEIRYEKDYRFLKKIKILLNNLSEGCHQIDVKNNILYITDTYNNKIISYKLRNNEINEFFPLGKLDNGRTSDNYGHINSIFKVKDDEIYLLCHNETAKTGKNSEILIVNDKFNIKSFNKTNSNSAHNIIKYKDKLYHCDSIDAHLKVDNKIVFTGEHFSRGLSISDDYIVVGGSEYAKRENRKYAKGNLYFLNHDYKIITTINIPSMVQEIRRLDMRDYSLSDF